MVFFQLFLMLIVILIAAEVFTNALEHLGEKLGISEGVTGSLFAAVGTALPETMVPLLALLAGTQNVATNEESNVATNEATNASTNVANELQEVNMDEVEELEHMHMKLKKPTEVYYNMYRIAKQKARELKKNAIAAYLEAKQIKSAHMLEDSSDESDEEEYE